MRAVTWIGCVALVVGSGCSFPEPTVVELDAADSSGADSIASGETSSDATLGESSNDAIADDDTSVSDVVSGDGEASTEEAGDGAASDGSDAVTDVVDGDVKPISTCETGDPCDCDGDGDKKPGAGCDGNDCDDGDRRRNSLVSGFQSHDATGTPHGGDWDCSMVVQKEFGNGGFTCSGVLSGTACTGSKGYREAPADVKCGGMATVGGCMVNGLTVCVDDPSKTQTNQIVKCK